MYPRMGLEKIFLQSVVRGKDLKVEAVADKLTGDNLGGDNEASAEVCVLVLVLGVIALDLEQLPGAIEWDSSLGEVLGELLAGVADADTVANAVIIAEIIPGGGGLVLGVEDVGAVCGLDPVEAHFLFPFLFPYT